MAYGESPDRQLCLFLTRLTWHELPTEIRHQVMQLLARLCIDIVVQQCPLPEEQSDEPTQA